MTGRKQARAMDLPKYPCPPSLGAVPDHAGSWGWFNPVALPGHVVVAQDADGYLWARSSKHLAPEPGIGLPRALATWTEAGLGLYLDPDAYSCVLRVDNRDLSEWTPVAEVLSEPPAYALNFLD